MMKLLVIVCVVCLISFVGCGRPKLQTATDDLNNTSNLTPGRHYYLACFEKDTALLSFTVAGNGKLTGQLNVKYYNADSVTFLREPTKGNITGEFRGDTLFADYSFYSGKTGKAKFINPVALIHKNDTLIMGHGRIYYYLGRTYFDPATPVSFSKSRFKFMPVTGIKWKLLMPEDF